MVCLGYNSGLSSGFISITKASQKHHKGVKTVALRLLDDAALRRAYLHSLDKMVSRSDGISAFSASPSGDMPGLFPTLSRFFYSDGEKKIDGEQFLPFQ